MQPSPRQTWSTSSAYDFLFPAAVLLAALGIAAGLTVVSAKLTVVAFLALAGCALIFCYPYVGLILFLGLLFVRPEQFFPVVDRGNHPDEQLSSFTFFAYVVIGGTLMAWLLRLLTRREQLHWAPELGWVIAYGAAIVLSSYQVPDAEYAFSTALEVGKMFAFFLLLQQLLNTEKRITVTVQWWLAFVVVLSLSGIYGWVTGTNALNEHGVLRARVGGPFTSPNALAAALVLVVPIALMFLLKAERNITRLWGALALAILLVGIFLTNSRSGMLGVGVAFGVLLVGRYGWGYGAAVAAILLGMFAILGPERFTEQTFSSEAIAGDDSAMGRIIAWETGMRLFTEHPLLGVGFRRFIEYHWLDPHNSFLQALAEVGLFGALCWVGFHYWANLSLWRVRKTETPATGLTLADYALAVQAGLLGSLTAGMFLNRAYRLETLIPIAIAAAMATVVLRGNAAERQPEEKRLRFRLAHAAAVPAIVLVLIAGLYLSVAKLQ